MHEKITYFSDLPSAPNTKVEELTKIQAEKKFGIKWVDSNIEEKNMTDVIPLGHESQVSPHFLLIFSSN